LLVSVRSAGEVEAAVQGGADIVDAKEPMRGPLGAVDAAELARIAAAVPDGMPLSLALGDLATPATAATGLDLTRAVARRPAELYVKLGLAGVVHPTVARSVLEAAVSAARRSPLEPDVVAVAYADYRLAQAVAPRIVLEAAAETGVRGVLLDTWTKEGRPLFTWMRWAEIYGWVEGARSRGLLTALAGSLALDHMPLVCRLGPDVFGVRGAACEGGRAGVVSTELVRQLAAASRRTNPHSALPHNSLA
jgi:(5-formylfuran-3-yl)methyl phosphate synthase